uniref:Uncharacterized protein n=1 Tax=Arundo donax TaxID=35708 RepID=A0A0A8YH48_ARUDO
MFYQYILDFNQPLRNNSTETNSLVHIGNLKWFLINI